MLQIKSKQRVANFGEVFTAEREVNAMLDLVKKETVRIESRFLEPACGDGNFLIEILRRKLLVVKSKYQKKQSEYEINAIIAVSSVYGLDILEDNVMECRYRLYKYLHDEYAALFKQKCKEKFRKSVKAILGRNIIWGNTLDMKSLGGKERDIVFSEWSLLKNRMIKRCDYKMVDLLANSKITNPCLAKAFPPIHYLKLGTYV